MGSAQNHAEMAHPQRFPPPVVTSSEHRDQVARKPLRTVNGPHLIQAELLQRQRSCLRKATSGGIVGKENSQMACDGGIVGKENSQMACDGAVRTKWPRRRASSCNG